jgi:hypothetical protein
MVNSGDIHPYPNDHHRRVSRIVLMWVPLAAELFILAMSAFALWVPRTEKWLVVLGMAVIAVGMVGTIVAALRRPRLALEQKRQVTVFDEGAPRKEHMEVADGMVVASSTTAPTQSYAWFLVSFVGLLLVVVASWPILSVR